MKASTHICDMNITTSGGSHDSEKAGKELDKKGVLQGWIKHRDK